MFDGNNGGIMNINEVQERWNIAADGLISCCYALTTKIDPDEYIYDEDGYPVAFKERKRCKDSFLCRSCQASLLLQIFMPGENIHSCGELFSRRGYGRYIRRHIVWTIGMTNWEPEHSLSSIKESFEEIKTKRFFQE